MMIPLFLKLKNNKTYRTVIIIIFIISVCLIGIFIDNVFPKSKIDDKYCYIEINDTLRNVLLANTKKKGYEVASYYMKKITNREVKFEYNDVGPLRRLTEVEVLKYEEDSLLVKIRVHIKSSLRGGMEFDSEGWVPFFTLHDTLPESSMPYDER